MGETPPPTMAWWGRLQLEQEQLAGPERLKAALGRPEIHLVEVWIGAKVSEPIEFGDDEADGMLAPKRSWQRSRGRSSPHGRCWPDMLDYRQDCELRQVRVGRSAQEAWELNRFGSSQNPY